MSLLAQEEDCKILCITETMLNSDISDCEIEINNFRIFRKDRLISKGGGSCIYVHNSIQAILLDDFLIDDCIAVKLFFKPTPLIIFCIYRSPSLDYDACNQMILKLDHYISKIDNCKILTIGDFNLPHVLWDDYIVDCTIDTKNKALLMEQRFLDLFSAHDFTHILGDGNVTRRRLVNDKLQESLLDQVFVSDRNIVKSFTITSPLGKSDHCSIMCNLSVVPDISLLNLNKKNWSTITTEQFNTVDITTDWNYSNGNLTTEEMWDELTGKIDAYIALVPEISVKVSKNGIVYNKSPGWQPNSLKKARRKKDRLWAEFDESPSSRTYNLALQAQADFEKKQRTCMINYEKKIAKCVKTNPKRFYSYLNSKRKAKGSAIHLKDSSGSWAETAEQSANLLADFFASTFKPEDKDTALNIDHDMQLSEKEIGDIMFEKRALQKLLRDLKIDKSMGPDGVHPKLLKHLSNNDNFTSSLLELFQKCFNTGKIPKVWKTAHVTPLHKKGDKSDPRNYRPISLTCVLSKVYEKLLRNHLLDHIEPFIFKNQHGFVPNRSCMSNLLDTMDVAYDLMDTQGAVDILYLDFEKAFDTVGHQKLLLKLRHYGVTGKSLNAVEDFLSDRYFSVRVGNGFSETRCVTSGVPQGTVLGPLLFLIYINDLPNGITSYVSLFADDLKIVADVSNRSISNEDLEKLNIWQKTWDINFNVKDNKCKVLHAGKNNTKLQYHLDGALLPAVEEERDLGVVVDEALKWDKQIQKSMSKTKQVIGWVRRNVISRDQETMLMVYKSLIRPHLEYCVQVWNLPAKHGNWGIIKEIESVQRGFTKLIDGLWHLPYRERLEKLKLTTLLERRMRGDLIETYKILSGKTDYGQDLYRLSRSGMKLVYKGKAGRYRDSFLSNRVIPFWNKIPDSVKSVDTVDAFKAALEAFKQKHLNERDTGNFWDLSEELLDRMSSSDEQRDQYVEYMMDNPDVAKRRGITI